MGNRQKSPLAQKLIRHRKANKLTQSQIADSLNIKRSTYAYYECSTTPPLDILSKLAKLFGVTVDDLLGTAAPEPYNTAPVSGVLRFAQETPYIVGANSETLTGDEKILLLRYRILNSEMKQKVNSFLESCVDDMSK